MRSSLHYYNGRFCSLLATYISQKAGGSAVHYVGHNLCMCGVWLDADQICFKFSLLVWCEISWHGQSWFLQPHCLLQTLQMEWHLLNSLLVLYHEPFLKKRYRNLLIFAIQMSQFIFFREACQIRCSRVIHHCIQLACYEPLQSSTWRGGKLCLQCIWITMGLLVHG